MPRPLLGRSPRPVREISRRQERTSPRLRGYDSRWDRLSAEFRRRHPFCAWCQQQGRDILGDLVDHKIPVAEGGQIYHLANLWTLCTAHHGRKTEMEEYARRNEALHLLPIWCDSPDERPQRFCGTGLRE